MADEIKKYCEGLDCAICDEKEPCIYKIANELEQKLANKEQECERLKNERTVDLVKQLDQLKAENKHLNDLLNQALKDYDKARETLTEIKEIAEENDELLQGYHTEWANNKIILYKITECEGNDETN